MKFILIFIFIFFLCCNPVLSLELNIPRMADSIITEDFDNDSDLDIVIGHQVSWGNSNPRLTILENVNGIFTVLDSTISFCGGGKVHPLDINNDSIMDFVTFGANFSSDETYRFIRLFENQGNFSFENYDLPLEIEDVSRVISSGFLNNDEFIDIVCFSRSANFWGRMFNYNGNLEQPQYYHLDFNCSDLKCAKLNNDDSYDVVVSGQNTNIYYSFGNNFILDSINHAHFNTDIEIIDYDNDGDNDIIGCVNVMGVATPLYFYQNQGGMDFAVVDTVVVNPGLSTVLYHDMDQDGFFDVIGFNGFGLYLYINNGSNDFGDPEFYHIPDMMQPFYPMTLGDLDSNGFTDIALVASTSLITFYNNGDGDLSSEPESNNSSHNYAESSNLTITYPNPSHSIIEFQVGIVDENLEIKIFNIKGQHVKTIKPSSVTEGKSYFIWSGLDKKGKPVSNGVYLYKTKIGKYCESGRIDFIK